MSSSSPSGETRLTALQHLSGGVAVREISALSARQPRIANRTHRPRICGGSVPSGDVVSAPVMGYRATRGHVRRSTSEGRDPAMRLAWVFLLLIVFLQHCRSCSNRDRLGKRTRSRRRRGSAQLGLRQLCRGGSRIARLHRHAVCVDRARAATRLGRRRARCRRGSPTGPATCPIEHRPWARALEAMAQQAQVLARGPRALRPLGRNPRRGRAVPRLGMRLDG